MAVGDQAGVRWGKRNKTAVRTTFRVKVGNQVLNIKRVPAFMPILMEAAMEAGAVQLRVISEEARELLIDRIFAAAPQVTTGLHPPQLTAERPDRLRQAKIKIRRGPFNPPLAALAEDYANRKAREGADGRILLALGDYVKGIEVFKGQQKEGGVYYMVRPEQREHEPTGVLLSKLARWLEGGTSRMAPRPHWAPVLKQIKAHLNDRKVRRDVRAAALRLALQEIR